MLYLKAPAADKAKKPSGGNVRGIVLEIVHGGLENLEVLITLHTSKQTHLLLPIIPFKTKLLIDFYCILVL